MKYSDDHKNRVVVTGMGLVSPLGTTVDSCFKSAIDGKSGVKKIDRFYIPDTISQIAGVVDNYEPDSAEVYNNYHGYDRSVLFAIDAIDQACSEANINLEKMMSLDKKCSLVVSSAVAAITSMERYYINNKKNGTQFSSWQPNENYFEFNYITNILSKKYGINGRSLLIPTGCAGCLDALSYSVNLIRNGQSDVVISGATESPITPLVIASFNKIGATADNYNDDPTAASMPFDKNREGFVLAEGCGMLVLESLEYALDRGANILAEITGFGSSNNCYHMTNIPEDGVSIYKACKKAVEDAGISPDSIDHVNAHGSSTPQNDVAETNALRLLMPDNYNQVSVTSNKSRLGHALAASNALETILTVKSINESIVLPTINLKQKDERCDLNVVANQAKHQDINTVLKISSGFSGIHTSLVIQKYIEGVA